MKKQVSNVGIFFFFFLNPLPSLYPQTQVFAADGAVAESSQSGTPQGEGKNLFLFLPIYIYSSLRSTLQIDQLLKFSVYPVPCLCFLFSDSFFFSPPAPFASQASTPEEMREEKKEQEGDRGGTSEESRAAKAKASKPLMPTSTILRLLAELVRSYVGIATLIATYNYTAGQSELIKEVSG